MEMADRLVLDMVDKDLVTNQIILTIGYDRESLADPEFCKNYKGEIITDHYGRSIPKYAHGTTNLEYTSSSQSIVSAVGGGRDRDEEKLQMRKAINAVCEGIEILQDLKMGALIVFERNTNLGEIIGTGTQINCSPTGQIVGNIFFNKAPLHDGAMIVRNGLIHAAGCILPLTKNPAVAAELGTRHRAALGVSEESDGVAIVVSEETGNISVAVNGSLTRDYTKDTLRDALETLLIAPDEKASGVRRSLSFISKKAVKK